MPILCCQPKISQSSIGWEESPSKDLKSSSVDQAEHHVSYTSDYQGSILAAYLIKSEFSVFVRSSPEGALVTRRFPVQTV